MPDLAPAIPRGDAPRRHPLRPRPTTPEPGRVYVRRIGDDPVQLRHPSVLRALDALPAYAVGAVEIAPAPRRFNRNAI